MSRLRYQDGSGQHLRFMHQSFDGAINKAEAMRLFLDSAGIAIPRHAPIFPERKSNIRRRSVFSGGKGDLLELRRRGFLLGMITNSYQSAAEKASWFRALGLDCIAERVVSSIDAGVSKPDKGIYLEFARRVGLSRGKLPS